ncbi:MAG TPA: pyrroline-5-carboxylate reductase [Candidatus Omnitrophota bacterium]|nr:pyrroline-5-carboxylate reductase [Candidatus Omnitrophota bacterium]
MRYSKRNKRIGIIGLGNMGGAVMRGLARTRSGGAGAGALAGYDCDPAKARAAGRIARVKAFSSAAELARLSDIVVIAVKPKDFAQAAREVSAHAKGKLFITIAAGIRTGTAEKLIGGRARVVRVMPNTPALIGEGISAICGGRYATPTDVAAARRIFSSVGETVVLDERHFDLVTAVSGSGPAYFFYLKEALMEAAAQMGLGRDMARRLVSRTALGAAKLLIETGHEPGVLRGHVTSKGGTTEQAMKVFEKAGFKRVVRKAVAAAVKRSRQLSGG